jgi:hypothetical protein
MGEKLEVVRTKFLTVSSAVLLKTPKMCSIQMAISKIENSGQVSSRWLKFVHGCVLVHKWTSAITTTSSPRLEMQSAFSSQCMAPQNSML